MWLAVTKNIQTRSHHDHHLENIQTTSHHDHAQILLPSVGTPSLVHLRLLPARPAPEVQARAFGFWGAAARQKAQPRRYLARAKNFFLFSCTAEGFALSFRWAPIASHSQTCRLLTLSLSLGVPAPRPTQCMRDE